MTDFHKIFLCIALYPQFAFIFVGKRLFVSIRLCLQMDSFVFVLPFSAMEYPSFSIVQDDFVLFSLCCESLLWFCYFCFHSVKGIQTRTQVSMHNDNEHNGNSWMKCIILWYRFDFIYTCEQYPNVFYRFWAQYTTIQNEIHTYTKVPFDVVICAGFQCYEKCMVFSSFCMPSILDFIVRIDTIWNKSAKWFRRIMVHRSWKYNLIEIDWNWEKNAPSSTQTCFFVRLNLLSFDRRHPFV